jgi:hypothetical protein
MKDKWPKEWDMRRSGHFRFRATLSEALMKTSLQSAAEYCLPTLLDVPAPIFFTNNLPEFPRELRYVFLAGPEKAAQDADLLHQLQASSNPVYFKLGRRRAKLFLVLPPSQ